MSREERETEKEHLLFSLHGQFFTFLCFDMKDKLYDYTDCTARKTLQDSLHLWFSPVGGMFESITTTMQSNCNLKLISSYFQKFRGPIWLSRNPG